MTNKFKTPFVKSVEAGREEFADFFSYVFRKIKTILESKICINRRATQRLTLLQSNIIRFLTPLKELGLFCGGGKESKCGNIIRGLKNMTPSR